MARELRLGMNIGYWGGGPPPGILDSIKEAERLGFESVWTAEAYGSDALVPLAWWGASTERIKLGTAIVQISARTPAATAMAAMTLDHVSGGRLILGLGVSGPQVVEGWYGQSFAKPLARMREYIGILRHIWDREGPVTNDGDHYPLPLKSGTGLGKPLKSSIHPLRKRSRSTSPRRGRRREDPGALPVKPQAGSRRRGAARADREAHADRAEGQDSPRPRGVARLERYDVADRWRRRDDPGGRRGRALLISSGARMRAP